MIEVVGVRFKKVGRVYYFGPEGLEIHKGDNVIVETARGIEYGEVVMPNREVTEDSIVQPLKKVLRIATPQDDQHLKDNKEKEISAFDVCLEKISLHKLDMKLIDVEYTFDNNKVLFYFTADGRVDFRDLVKDLAAVFRTRIELRQIGVRDEAKMMGGLGICGNPLCCSTFLGDFQPVSIKMAKEQGLSLNPTKISGSCGRLMCCLKYEQDTYEELLKAIPPVGSVVQTSAGTGIVTEANLLKGELKVRLDATPDVPPKAYKKDEVKIIKEARVTIEKEELDALSSLEE